MELSLFHGSDDGQGRQGQVRPGRSTQQSLAPSSGPGSFKWRILPPQRPLLSLLSCSAPAACQTLQRRRRSSSSSPASYSLSLSLAKCTLHTPVGLPLELHDTTHLCPALPACPAGNPELDNQPYGESIEANEI